MKKIILSVGLCLGIICMINAQVTGVKYLIEYNDATSLYDCKIVILDGEATTYVQRIQFNTQYTIVVPTGTTLTIDVLHAPWENNATYTGTVPCLWDFGPKEIAPPTTPGLDYHTVIPNLSPPSAYNDLYAGDTITVFSISADVDPCENSIRTFENGIDPPSIDMPSGGDFSNGFILGPSPQMYSGNLSTNYGNYIALNGSLTICADDCVNLQPTIRCLEGPFTYEWSTGETSESIEVCPSEPSNYYVLIKDEEDNYLDSIPVFVDTTEILIYPSETSVCAGGSLTLEACPATGIWTQAPGNAFGAHLSQVEGGVTEVSFSEGVSGIYEIMYTVLGNTETVEITVYPAPLVNIATTEICKGHTTIAAANIAGGMWVSNNSAIASINPSTGEITGLDAGAATFTYTLPIGCTATTQPLLVTVDIVASFEGPEQICWQKITFVSPNTGGTWSSSDEDVATVSNSGLVFGRDNGIAQLVFTDSMGCQSNSLSVLVEPPSTELTGPDVICLGETTTINSTLEGTWSSADISIATIDDYGVITGVGTGVTTFTFRDTATLCVSYPSDPVTVISEDLEIYLPSTELCVGEKMNLSPSSSGSWTSSNVLVAMIDESTGEVNTYSGGSVSFTFTPESGNCQATSGILSVIEKPIIEEDPFTMCAGWSTALHPDTGGTWTSSNPLIGTVKNNGNFTSVSAGTVEVVYTDSITGCTSDPLEIEVIESIATPTVYNNGPLCEGEELELTRDVNIPVVHSWTGPNGFTSTEREPTIPNISPLDNGQYCLTISDLSCISEPGCTDVVVKPTPNVTAVLNNGPICVGETIELSTSAISGAVYQWTGPFGFTSNDQNPVLSAATTSNAGLYCVIVTVDGCDSQAECAEVVIAPIPSTPTANNNGPLCEGEDLQLTTDAVNNATYQWSGPNGFSSSQQNVTVSGATTSDAGSYCVQVTVDGCASLEGCTVVFINSLPNIPVASSNGPICDDGDLLLTTDAVPGATYVWTGPNGFTSTVQNPIVVGPSPGIYCVTVSVDGCESQEGCTEVDMDCPCPVMENTITLFGSNEFCGESEELTITGADALPNGGTYNWEYSYNFGAFALVNGNNDQRDYTTNVLPIGHHRFRRIYTISDPIPCEDFSNIINVNILSSPPAPTPNNNGPICEGENIELTTNNVTNASYHWTGPNGFTSQDQNPVIIVANPSESGSYCVVVTVDGCESFEGCTDVIVRPTPTTPTANNNGPICEGESVELITDAVAGAVYSWSGPDGFTSNNQNPNISNSTTASSGTYCVIVSIDGCDSEESCTDVVINYIPAEPIIISNTPVCIGEDLELSTEHIPGAIYNWISPSGLFSTEQNPTISNMSFADAGNYSLMMGLNGCTITSELHAVEVISISEPLIISNNSPVCKGEMVELSVDEVDGAQYIWNGPDGALFSGSTISFLAGEHPEGYYEVVMDYEGCSKVSVSEVSYFEKEIIITERDNVCKGESISISPNSGGIFTLSDNNIGVINGGTFVALESGTTEIIYTSDLGCESDPVTITVLNCIEPVASCDEISADDIICDFNDLKNIGGTLSEQISGGNQPSGELCNDGDGAHNMSWLGFVALEGDYDIVVNINNCFAFLGGEFGAQVGVYSDCNFSELTKIFCESSKEENHQIRISSDILTKGETYFLYIDGFDQSICDYSIDVDGFYDNTYCTDLSKVTGVAYIDDNENGTYEEGETLLRNALISLSPGNFSVLTNDEGKYIINTPKGGATLTAKMNEGHWINDELTIEDLSIFETCVEGINFGFVPNLFYQEANISVANSVTRCDWETRFYFTVENTGTIDLDGVIKFEFDSKASYFATNLIGLQVNGNIATGDLGIIEPFEVREFWIKLKMPKGSVVLPMLDFKTTLYNKAEIEMDQYEHSEQLRCSYDPNDKREFPNREGEENLTLMDEDIEYTIRFQNNGNDTAFQVKIIDPLDTNIDRTSIRVISSSHAVETCIENDNLIFIFENINLVDSMTNYEGSQGYVSFRCSSKEDRLENTIVHNTADIIFDTNDPIVTNITINTLVSELCTDVTTEIDVEICEGETYNGHEDSGTYTERYPLLFGCDSIVIINLDVQGITYSSQDMEVCEGETFEINDKEFILYESQQIRDTMYSALECVSNVFIFNVTVNPILKIDIDTTICEGLDYQGYTESGIYTIDSFDEVTGCDIITTIDLEVLPIGDPACTVGLDDQISSEIKMYPIPARDVLYIEGDDNISTVSIFTMEYQKIEELNFDKGLQKIQLSTDRLIQGLYMIAIESKGIVTYKKLIVE